MILLYGIVLTFALALIVDIWCADKNKGDKLVVSFIKNSALVIALALIYLGIYLLDVINARYVWIAFVVGAAYLIGIDGFCGKAAIKKTGHKLGFGVISFIIFIYFGFSRYELQTNFSQPCWSPDGKQIAFFMEKGLYRYQKLFPSYFMLFAYPYGPWGSEGIWKKYYLCTMDYDGGNFKVVKETQKELLSDGISWTNQENITIITSNFKDIYKFHFPSKEVQKIYTITDPARLNEKAWLSPNGQYLAMSYYINQKVNQTYLFKRGILVYDVSNKKVLKEIKNDLAKDLHGSYSKNEFSFFEDDAVYAGEKATYRKQYFCNLDNNSIKGRSLPLDKGILDYLNGFEYHSLSPDRSMYAEAGGVWTIGDKVVSDFYVKPKRSYLFNIF